MSPPTDATAAEYLRLGLHLGLVAPADAKDWSMSIIERMPEPPAEIIDVSWSNSQSALEESLSAVVGARDRQLAGRWLLGNVRTRLGDGHRLLWCATKAQVVAGVAELGSDVYYEFDQLADELFLAINNPGTDVHTLRDALVSTLNKHAIEPFCHET